MKMYWRSKIMFREYIFPDGDLQIKWEIHFMERRKDE